MQYKNLDPLDVSLWGRQDRATRRTLIKQVAKPVGISLMGTLLTCAIFGLEWGRFLFVLGCTLPFNLWYFGTFKRRAS